MKRQSFHRELACLRVVSPLEGGATLHLEREDIAAVSESARAAAPRLADGSHRAKLAKRQGVPNGDRIRHGAQGGGSHHRQPDELEREVGELMDAYRDETTQAAEVRVASSQSEATADRPDDDDEESQRDGKTPLRGPLHRQVLRVEESLVGALLIDERRRERSAADACDWMACDDRQSRDGSGELWSDVVPMAQLACEVAALEGDGNRAYRKRSSGEDGQSVGSKNRANVSGSDGTRTPR